MVLVGVPVDDAGLDLAADPAVGSDRHTAAEVGPEQLGIAADIAGALDPSERLHDHPGGDRDRPAGGIEDGVRVDPRRLVDEQPLGRADDGGGGLVAAAQTRAAGDREVAGQVVGVLDHEVPGVRDPFAAEVHNLRPGCHLVEPGVDSTPFEADGQVGADGREAGRLSQVPTQGMTESGGRKSAGGTQRALTTRTGARASQFRSLMAVPGSRSRQRAARWGRIIAPCRAGSGPIPKARATLSPSVCAPAQLVCRAGQAQRLKTGHDPIFD